MISSHGQTGFALVRLDRLEETQRRYRRRRNSGCAEQSRHGSRHEGKDSAAGGRAKTRSIVAYHDTEWGVPEYDPRALYEKLVLDGFQAGLSWITILRKRENFRKAFHDFAPEKIARYGKRDLERLLKNEGIIRSRAKIEAAIKGAQAVAGDRGKGAGRLSRTDLEACRRQAADQSLQGPRTRCRPRPR